MTIDMPEVLTPLEVADTLKCSVEAVIKELESGRLRGFRIGDDWRSTIEELVTFVGSTKKPVTAETKQSEVKWKKIAAFQFKWPSNTEDFDSGWEADVPVDGKQLHILIGFTDRESAGKSRRRTVVFWGYLPHPHPLVEFAGANDFESTKKMASVIKGRDNKHVRSTSQLPPEYSGLPFAIFNQVVVGPYAANSLAVVASADDLATMARHGILRAKFKQLI